MKYLSIIVAIACVLIAHPLPAETGGWTSQNKQEMTEGCVQGVLEPTRQDFAARAAKAGNPDAVFPEEKIRPSFETLCGCIIDRAAEAFTFQEVITDPQRTQTLIAEAVQGGECKPGFPLDGAHWTVPDFSY